MVTTITSSNGTGERTDGDLLRVMEEAERSRYQVVEREREPVRGIFDGDDDLFTRYRVEIRCTGMLMGGIPKKPDVVAAWLRTKAMISDDVELALAVRETLRQQGLDVPEAATLAEMVAASKHLAAEQHGNGFKRDAAGLFVEGRQIKAMLKECTNIVYVGQRLGKQTGRNAKGDEVTTYGGKSAKAYLAERVFVDDDDDRIHLGIDEPDGTHLQIGQVSGPQGPRSTLTYYDYAWQPSLAFTVLSLEDCIKAEQWRAILKQAQENGLGSLRSQGHGRFKVVAFDRL